MPNHFITATALAVTLTFSIGAAVADHVPEHHQGSKAYQGFSHPLLGTLSNRPSQPPRLGVAVAPIALADLDRMGIEHGVRIERVIDGSAAEAAGLRADDIVTAVDGRPVYSPERLRHLVRSSDDMATVELSRGGTELTLTAELSTPTASVPSGRAVLGIRVQPMTDDLREALGADADQGVLVSEVRTDDADVDLDLRAGDILVSVEGRPVGEIADIRDVLADRQPGDVVDVELIRDKAPMSAAVTLSAAPIRSMRPAWHPYLGQWHHGQGYRPHLGMKEGHGCGPKPSIYRS